MKKPLLITLLLIIIDQVIKILIWEFAFGQLLVIIPRILRFEPYQNTSLNWFASMAGVTMPLFLMIILQLAAAGALIVFYQYQSDCFPPTNAWLHYGFSCALAGVACSFLDVTCWGGSLDYIGLLNWFIFDLKDVYLNCGWISLLIWLNSRIDYRNEKDPQIFRRWFNQTYQRFIRR